MKFRLLFFMVLFPLFCLAKHVEFMGVELNGTLSDFTSKLNAKGLTVDRQASQRHPDVRFFDGYFFKQKCSIIVYYDPKTKLVYRAKAIVDFSSLSQAKNYLNQVLDGLASKYGEGYTIEEKLDEYISFYRRALVDKSITSENQGQVGYLRIGEVQIYLSKKLYERYTVSVDYWDHVNYNQYHSNHLNDL